ncbi:MAG: ATP-dependent sacrificial sulfur transferase LarE, partial [Lachnospiraceae bacterium]|nr:ATP-dependent sacrificial sulfur transferase LarE [Lachnospiraceae bacterium]
MDSTFLLKAAQEAMDGRVLAVTVKSAFFPERETAEAAAFCAENGIEQVVCEINELEIEGIRENPENRCYLCKGELFREILRIAAEHGMNVVAEGSNVDDLGDYRPGLAAIRELGIASPLREAGLTKADIRSLSEELGLSTWDKPSFACLASRIPYGDRISEEKLAMIDRAEQLLLDMGFHQV